MGSYKVECNKSCVNNIRVRLKDGIIKEISFDGGCQCMFSTFNQLSKDRNIDEVLGLLKEVDLKCVNEENCIGILIKLLEDSKIKEQEKERKLREFRLTPEGILKNINIIINKKPPIDFSKKYILIKIHSDLYDTFMENIKEVNNQISVEYKVEKNDDFEGDYIFNTVYKEVYDNQEVQE